MTEFRGVAAATQAISITTVTEVNFGTEIMDTDLVFASNRCTISGTWNGLMGEFYAACRFNASIDGYIEIQVSTDGGTGWTPVVRSSFDTATVACVQTGPVFLNINDIYRTVIYTTSAVTIENNTRTYFSGRVLGVVPLVAQEHFRARAASTQVIANTTLTPITTLTTEEFDTGADLVSGVYTVPPALSGGSGLFSAGIANDDGFSGENLSLYITRSTDGGSNYTDLVTTKSGIFAEGVTMSTGPLLLAEGDKFRVEVYTNSGGFTLANATRTFFSGEAYTIVAPAPPTLGTDAAFRAVKSASTQIILNPSTNPQEIVFDSEIFDTLNAFAANRFTVPVAIDGSYINFTAGCQTSSNEFHRIYLERSTDGGTGWTEVAANADSSNILLNLTSGPILCTTGHIYRISYSDDDTGGAGATIQNTDLTFFSGYIRTS